MTAQPKGGRPAHAPTDKDRKQVESLAGFGIPQAEIARLIGISIHTLEKHYREELDTGASKANAQVAQALFKRALGSDASAVTAAIFWLKTRARWSETVNISNPDGTLRPEPYQAAVIEALSRIHET